MIVKNDPLPEPAAVDPPIAPLLFSVPAMPSAALLVFVAVLVVVVFSDCEVEEPAPMVFWPAEAPVVAAPPAVLPVAAPNRKAPLVLPLCVWVVEPLEAPEVPTPTVSCWADAPKASPTTATPASRAILMFFMVRFSPS